MNELFCSLAYSAAQDVLALSTERFNDFRTRCDFPGAFPEPFLPSLNQDVGGLGNDWAEGDSKHLLAAKKEKLGGEHDPLRRLLLPLFVCPAALEEWDLLGVLMLIDFDGVGRCCCWWVPLECFLLLGLPLAKNLSLDGEFLLFVPILFLFKIVTLYVWWWKEL